MRRTAQNLQPNDEADQLEMMKILSKGSPIKTPGDKQNEPAMRDHIEEMVRQQLMERQTATNFNATTPVTGLGLPNFNRYDDDEQNARFQQKMALLQ